MFNLKPVGTLTFFTEVRHANDIAEAVRWLDNSGNIVIDITPIYEGDGVTAVFFQVAGETKALPAIGTTDEMPG